MPILNWIGKEKIVNHDKDVPFRLMKKNKKYSLGQSENLILEGDNLEALKALMPFYYGKVKCIYIDPPYNTGKEKWIYNDKVNSPKIKQWLGKVVGPESEDLCRHDKWLCMMYPRLKLLRDLLSEDGVIFISIDDNEQFNLRILMDEIFGAENFIANIIRVTGSTRNMAVNVDLRNDYMLFYAKSIKKFNIKKIKRKDTSEFLNPDKDPNGLWSTQDLTVRTGGFKYSIPSIDGGKSFFKNWGKSLEEMKIIMGGTPDQNFESIYKKAKIIKVGKNEYYLLDRVVFKGKKNIPNLKKYLSKVNSTVTNSIWNDIESQKYANDTLIKIIGKKVFENPKPVGLIKKAMIISTSKDSIILDSFAGSGTTAHAVLDLNKEDGGNRKFILIEMEKNIAKKITAERVKRVANGYSYKKNDGKAVKVAGLGSGFEYVELGKPLFDKDGMIDKEMKFNDLASYVYFTETYTNLDKSKIKGNYLGDYGSCHYFLLFNSIGKNVLSRKFLKEVKNKDGKKIIYADKCLLDDDVLEKHQIIFKQIPYQIKVY